MPITSRFAAAAARAYGMFRVAASAAVDPFFNYVTALLHGDGTNGAQNNTFLDSSTNNFTITRNGNTTQGSFSPFSQTGWSNYFDGVSDTLTLTTSSSLSLTGAFTVEFWIYLNSTALDTLQPSIITFPTQPNAYQIYINSTNTYFALYNGTADVVQTANGTATLNQWHHIAISRDASNNLSIFLNGTRSATTASGSGTIGTSTGTFRLMSYSGTTGDVNGYLSNLRIVKGTAVYDPTQTTLTVPTSPLTAITNTQLLTCQSNRFIDNSSNAFAITAGGDVSVQPFSPFNPTSAWSASSNGGSGYFDGSGDYLVTPSNAALQYGTGDYTYECWIYHTSISGQQTYFARSTAGNYNGVYFYKDTSNYVGVYYTTQIATSNVTITANQWYYLVASRLSGTLRIFINGVQVASVSDSTNLTESVVTVGADANGSSPFSGFMCGARILKGVGYSSITVPTSPPTAITNTSLLLNYTNGGIYDNAAVADYETVGNAQISTSVKKYGTGSISFDGSGDYLVTDAPSTQLQALGTGDFTVELWLYANTVSSIQTILDWRDASTVAAYPLLALDSNGTLVWSHTNNSRIISGAISASTWYHVAVCRVAGQTRMFINGTQSGSTYADTTNYLTSTGAPRIGIDFRGAPLYYLNGYIDDFRITKGVGRYQYNFTPPAAAFPNIGGTVTPTSDQYFNYTTLLLPGNGTNGAQNNTFLDSSSNAFTITRNGNTTQGTFTPFSQTGWGNYFDGTANGYLSTPATTDLDLSADFTVQAWVYPTANGQSSNSEIISRGATTTLDGWHLMLLSGTTQPCFQVNYSGTGNSTTSIQSSTNVPLNYWTHIAVTRSGNTAKIYINGSLDTTNTGFTTAPTTNGSDVVYIGRASYDTTNRQFTGYISNASVIKGTALTTFNTSAALSTSTSGQSLLTCTSNRFIDTNTATTAKTITAGSGVSVQAFSPFAPTASYSASTNGGSGYFDGSGDYLTAASNAAFDMGSGDFTIEIWVYPTSFSGNQAYLTRANNSSTYPSFELFLNASNLYFYTSSTGSSYNTSIASSIALKLNAWNHIAGTRNGSTYTLWVNGASGGTATSSASLIANGNTLGIGGYPSGTSTLNGYLADVRIVKGTAVYTAAFTPPTAPLTAIANTSLLLSYTNGGITDATAKNDLETVGNAQISTTQSKFGGSSMAFDGTDDRLVPAGNQNFAFGTGDFTVEAWVWTANVSNSGAGSQAGWIQTSDTAGGLKTTYTTGIMSWFGATTNGTVAANVGGTNYISAGSLVSTNTWYHIAITRYNGTVNVWLNGVSVASGTGNTSNLTGQYICVGGYYSTAYLLNGYIDDLRITKGVARYTANFTAPTAAFPLQ